MSPCIAKWFPFPSQCLSTRGFFSCVYCGDLVELQRVHATVLWAPLLQPLCPPGVARTEPPATRLLTAQGFLWVRVPMLGLPVFTWESLQSWGQGLALCHPSLMDQRRVVDFPVCAAFYLLGQSGVLPASYRRNQMILSFLIYKIGTMPGRAEQSYEEDEVN